MTQYINVARWQNKARAMFGIDGENPIPTLMELKPVGMIEGDRPENEFAGNGALFMGDSQDIAAGGAGNAGQVALLNPTSSGILAIIQQVDATAATSTLADVTGISEANVQANFTQLATFQQGNPRDSRLFGQRSALQMWFRNNAVFAGASYRWRIASRLGDLNQATGILVLHPGFGFVFADSVANEVFRLSAMWRERPQEQGKGS